MKISRHIAVVCLLSAAIFASAAVPLTWDVRPGQPAPITFDRYHGETLSFSATFRGFGELPFSPGADIRLWYQTNGMGSAWWSVPATVSSNVLSATWSPTFDPGSDRVSLFFGAPSNAYAAAVLRLRHSPGFAPGSMPDPIAFHESDPEFTAWLSSFQESDPAFASWLESYTPPDTSLEPSTNYTDRALSSFAATGTVARALTYGTPTRWTDSTGCVWEARNIGYADWLVETNGVPFMSLYYNGEGSWTNETTSLWWDYECWFCSGRNIDMGVEIQENVLEFAADTNIEIDDNPVWVSMRFSRPSIYIMKQSYIGRVALTNDIPAAPDLSPIQQDIADLRTESALVYRLYSGSNVVAEVTNYNSQVHAPSLRLLQLNESNEYITVWTETNGLARTLAAATNYADNAIADRAAPRAWSRTTSGLGAEAPSNTTWISTPTTVIAGGFEYSKFVDTYGEVWVLSSNGMAAEFNPDTNAYFRITADDGTPVFSVEKSDAQLVGANASGITVGESSITIPVPVVSSAAPTMYWRYSLSSGDWADETTHPSNMGVMWEGGPGTWQCNITFDGTRPSSMFFKFNFLQEGGVVIRNNATTDLSSGIWVNGVKFVPSVSGNNLIWTRQQ